MCLHGLTTTTAAAGCRSRPHNAVGYRRGSDVDRSIALLNIRGAQRADPGDRLVEEHDKTANNSVPERDPVVGEESAEDLLAVDLR